MNRVQRRYAVTIGAFALASVLVILLAASGSRDRINYDLPKIGPFQRESIDEVTIERRGSAATVRRSAGKWSVHPGGFPAHEPSAEFIVDAMIGLQISDVVSTQGDPSRFGLDEKSRVTVTMRAAGEELLVLHVGRRAASFGHTYIQIGGDSRVFQGGGELKTVFDRGMAELREKSVLSFEPDSIDEVTVSSTFGSPEAVRIRVVRDEAGWLQADRDVSDILRIDESTSIDEAGIDQALNFLGNLSAYQFRGDGDALGDPWLQLDIGSDGLQILVYEKEGNLFPARTSESEYDILMIGFQVGFFTTPFGLERPE